MDFGKNILIGILGQFLMAGIDIVYLDLDNQIIMLDIPRDSWDYKLKTPANIYNAESYAKRIKKMWIEMGIFQEGCKVKFREKDVYWTKEMGQENYEKHKDDILKWL